MNDALIPCPFCGSDVIGVTLPNFDIECKNLKCSLKLSYVTMADAIATWNTRAAPTMREWHWVAFGNHTLVEKTFNTQVIWTGLKWQAYMGIGFSIEIGLGYATCELAQSACVAYIKDKLKEWLV